MITLPVSLENDLKKVIPRARDRDKFVADLIRRELDTGTQFDQEQPETVGGTIYLFTDGGSRGNPGQAAIGCVLEDEQKGKIIREHYERIGIETNNVAEYRALIEGLKIAKRYHPNHLVCHLDSELVVKQVNGEYRVKMPSLKQYVDEILDLKQEFPHIVFKYIPRNDNYRADALVNKALDEHPAPHYEKPY